MILLKNIVLGLIPRTLKDMKAGFAVVSQRNPFLSRKEIILKCKLVNWNSKLDYRDDYVRQFDIISKKIKIDTSGHYVYPYDPMVYRMHNRCLVDIGSVTVDFGTILESDIRELYNKLDQVKDTCFSEREKRLLKGIEALSGRISKELKKNNDSRASLLTDYFEIMIYRKPRSFDEALQKILFYNSLFWQMGHRHVGLGRLDLILAPYYVKDMASGRIDANSARNMLKEFVLALGAQTVAKSMVLRGDTGQYILLGGQNKDGKSIDNELTALFLEVFTELKIPDPKLILRVNNNTSEEIWKKTIDCILTGIGSPLIMDEMPIMESMKRFGYKTEDVWNVGTSACWEPLIIGKSFDQNNPFHSAIAVKPLNDVILRGENFGTFDELYAAFKETYKVEVESVVKDLKFDCSPLFSLFYDDCIKRGKDFTAGGAIYANHGAQVVGLPNVVNALLNIKRLVYEEKLYTLSDCRRAIENNYEGMEDFQLMLSTTGKKFGAVDEEVISLVNDLMYYTGEVVKPLKCNGEPIKIGFSSPNYVLQSKLIAASLDGRKAGDPFAVHISPVSSNIDISEILDFSSRLRYNDNCINGNVVDFILPSSYILQQEKLVGILRNACSKGLFELQLNVMDKATLVDAKAHPEKYPNLVVRVWGFSAYFNDLPEDYKDNLIRRAEVYEAA